MKTIKFTSLQTFTKACKDSDIKLVKIDSTQTFTKDYKDSDIKSTWEWDKKGYEITTYVILTAATPYTETILECTLINENEERIKDYLMLMGFGVSEGKWTEDNVMFLIKSMLNK